MTKASRRVIRLPPREAATALRAGMVLIVVEILIRWVPLPRLARLLGVRLDLEPPLPASPVMSAAELSEHDRRQLRGARRVADRWPLSKGPCLRRSLVAGHLLRRHDPTIRVGVAGTGDRLQAHAWLEIEGRPLEDPGDHVPFQRPSDGGER